jgi:hypothetical protein
MVDRVHATWRDCPIAAMFLMDIKDVFPSRATGRLVYLMKVRQIDRDDI